MKYTQKCVLTNKTITTTFKYKNINYGICCDSCIPKLKSLINKVNSVKNKNIKNNNIKCVIMPDRTVVMEFEYKKNKYAVCCPGCIEPLKKIIDKVENAIVKSNKSKKSKKSKKGGAILN